MGFGCRGDAHNGRLRAAGLAHHPPQGDASNFAVHVCVFCDRRGALARVRHHDRDWPIIVSNAITLVLALAIIAMKLRYG
jgi:hypothetical protein